MVHLHNHSVFSATDSLCKPDQLAKKAIELGHPAVALTDHGTMFGIPDFVSACKDENEGYVTKTLEAKGLTPGSPEWLEAAAQIPDRVRPIIGCELYVAMGPMMRVPGKPNPNVKQDTGHLTVLVKNVEGYMNLNRIMTIGYQNHVYRKKPRIDIMDIIRHKEGLVLLTGCMYSWFNLWVMRHYWMLRDPEKGIEDPGYELLDKFDAYHVFGNEKQWPGYKRQFLDRIHTNFGILKDVFGDDLYVEMQDHHLPGQRLINGFWMEEFPNEKFVATNDVHYINKSDWDAQDFVTRIRWQTDDKNYRNSPIEYLDSPADKGQTFFKTAEELMWNTTGGNRIPTAITQEAINNTLEVAEKCSFVPKKDKSLFPSMSDNLKAKMGDMSVEEYIKHRCRQSDRYKPEYEERIAAELEVMVQMGYPEYFLIVADIIEYARNIGATPGPGRGSVGGSLVAYLLEIHSANPLEAGLKFFRFLNKERISMPDIDIDFPKRARQEIIRHIIEEYGQDRVCGIGTAASEKAKGCIQDFGRLAGIDKAEVDRFNRKLDDMTSFALISQDTPELIKELQVLLNSAEYSPAEKTALDLLRKVEGAIRSYGKHASGIVICSRPLYGEIPLFSNEYGDTLCTAYDMDALEKLGFCKVDILGLKQMDVINDCLLSLGLSRDKIPMNDEAALDLINRGETVGLFQLGTPSFQKIIRAGFRCSSIMDVCALNALNRPGPKDFKDEEGRTMIDHYVARKIGAEAVTYEFGPYMRPILEETYGVMIYQEQIMQIAMVMAGYSIGEADDLRKFVGKKLTENMTPEEKEPIIAPKRNKFIKGCMDNGFEEEVALRLWSQIETFGRYGFNKSHSYFYAMLAMWGAWLKAHYPTTFYGACLRHEDKEDVKLKLIGEIKRARIVLVGPHINMSSSEVMWNEEDKKIYLGFSDIKSVQGGVAEILLKEREANGPFRNLVEMCERLEARCKATGEDLPDKGSMARLAFAGVFNSIVPGKMGHEEYACSLLTSEPLSMVYIDPALRPGGKYKDKEYIQHPISRHSDQWVRLHDLGINMNQSGLLDTIRRNRSRKKQVGLHDIAIAWPPVADVDSEDLMEATRQSLFGYDARQRSLVDYDRPGSIEDVWGNVTEDWDRRRMQYVVGIVGPEVIETMTRPQSGAEPKPKLVFSLYDETAQIECMIFGDEAKIEKARGILFPGNIVHLHGWMRSRYFSANTVGKARKIKIPNEGGVTTDDIDQCDSSEGGPQGEYSGF